MREPDGWIQLRHVTRHNLADVEARFPLGVLTAVNGRLGSGKSTLVTQVLADVVAGYLGQEDSADEGVELEEAPSASGVDARGLDVFEPARACRPEADRAHPALESGDLHRHVRRGAQLFAGTAEASRRGYTPGRFSFNVAEGRCPTCEGEGFVAVELLFLPGTYAPCPHLRRGSLQPADARDPLPGGARSQTCSG